MTVYRGECYGGPADGETYASPVPWFKITGWIDYKHLAQQADERKGWSDPAPVHDTVYCWDDARAGWVPAP